MSEKTFPFGPIGRTTAGVDLTGKVALLGGAGRGIGLAIARSLFAHGASVVIQDLDPEIAREAAKSLSGDTRRVTHLDGDIADPACHDTLVRKTVDLHGGLDILVNNAAIQDRVEFGRWSFERMQQIFAANCSATIRLTQHAVEAMSHRGGGCVLNIGSVQGYRGISDMLPYSMSKAALRNLTETLARDLAHRRIRVNEIAPGWFDTHRNRDEMVDREKAEQMARKWVPLGRVGNPDDVGPLATLLCSDAASYITGQVIYVSGGMR